MNDNCAICGLNELEHHHFVSSKTKRPNDKCCCDIKSWGMNYQEKGLPKVCEEFKPNELDGICDNCDHDKECH